MVSRRKNAYASLFIVLLLLFAGCARTVEGGAASPEDAEDGIGHITLRRDTDVLALSFLLLDDGSLQCGLCLAQSDARNRSLSRGGAGYGRFSAGYCQRGA